MDSPALAREIGPVAGSVRIDAATRDASASLVGVRILDPPKQGSETRPNADHTPRYGSESQALDGLPTRRAAGNLVRPVRSTVTTKERWARFACHVTPRQLSLGVGSAGSPCPIVDQNLPRRFGLVSETIFMGFSPMACRRSTFDHWSHQWSSARLMRR
jgi:hypothetical protein